mmetsp:Transcript_21724/g.40961  ORF Transcript_21724/g.40961 Transcript_21724/m.40961 type:complete len:241 (+) Transcript_21724:392-1114(+)
MSRAGGNIEQGRRSSRGESWKGIGGISSREGIDRGGYSIELRYRRERRTRPFHHRNVRVDGRFERSHIDQIGGNVGGNTGGEDIRSGGDTVQHNVGVQLSPGCRGGTGGRVPHQSLPGTDTRLAQKAKRYGGIRPRCRSRRSLREAYVRLLSKIRVRYHMHAGIVASVEGSGRGRERRRRDTGIGRRGRDDDSASVVGIVERTGEFGGGEEVQCRVGCGGVCRPELYVYGGELCDVLGDG